MLPTLPITGLDIAPEELRTELIRAANWVADYLQAVPAGPVTRPRALDERRWLASSPLRDEGRPHTEFTDFIDREVAPFPCGNGHPAFFGWINSPPAPTAIIAELLSVTINASCGMGEHASMDLERGAVRALAELAGLPHGAGGVLTSGGSTANLLCLAAARSWYLASIDAEDGERYDAAHALLVCYQSADTHMSVGKSARTIGLPASRLRSIPLTDDRRLDAGALRTAVERDLAAGLLPFCVVSTTGSTATGAIDPIAEITAVCRDYGLWHHVDGAFGGLGAAHPALAPHYAGIADVDSLTVDPHKTLNVPIGCGAALVTDPERLRGAFSLRASYLDGNDAWPWLSDYTIELTRPAGRAFTVWAVLHQLGREGVTALLDGYLRHTALLRELIEAHPDLELVADGPWSITCFRYRTPGRGDAITTAIADRLRDRGRAFLATVDIDGELALRASICNYRTSEADIRTLVAEVLAIGAELCG
ncbi:L-2,4-diaminobutyrate decarboxylase [Actinorhabdospora filicis]|uniref:L-2,4-diaminobutyrate decarboxylase n=1 Tax=Actinorhabdospora filicis TaxID=1785913 RepID=A0A9W6W3F5_9ACTN|nr:pyridoxal-dependent decarboxylase [Actinorhabdospora filicis]GLZ78097.1 L-2,4-diaminobutyrate decarboxylase [Actinorhabdospora filicis]